MKIPYQLLWIRPADLQQLQSFLLRYRRTGRLLFSHLVQHALLLRFQVLLAAVEILRDLAVLRLTHVNRYQTRLLQIMKISLPSVRISRSDRLGIRAYHLLDVFNLEVDALHHLLLRGRQLIFLGHGGFVAGTEPNRCRFSSSKAYAAVLFEKFVRFLQGNFGMTHRPMGILAGLGLSTDLVLEARVI